MADWINMDKCLNRWIRIIDIYNWVVHSKQTIQINIDFSLTSIYSVYMAQEGRGGAF